MRDCSNLWKDVCSSWPAMKQNLIWRMRNGSSVRFWVDFWVPAFGPLQPLALKPLPEIELWKSCCDFTVDDAYNLSLLQERLPREIIDVFLSMSPPSPHVDNDVVAWNPSPDGSFSVRTAYMVLAWSPPDINSRLFQEIWKWRGPQRVKVLLWKVALEILLTNQQRLRRHMSELSDCPRCPGSVESVLHTLKDCKFASEVRGLIFPPAVVALFFSLDRVQ